MNYQIFEIKNFPNNTVENLSFTRKKHLFGGKYVIFKLLTMTYVHPNGNIFTI